MTILPASDASNSSALLSEKRHPAEDVEQPPAMEKQNRVEGEDDEYPEYVRERNRRQLEFWAYLQERGDMIPFGDEESEEEYCRFSQKGRKQTETTKDVPDGSFTPLPNFKDDPVLYKQLTTFAGKAVAYFNNLNYQCFIIKGIESVASSQYDGTHYLLTIKALDFNENDAPKILKAKIVDGIAADVLVCEL